MSTIAPYGSWTSPITSEQIAGASIRLGAPQVVGDTIYWLEGRPREQGRTVLVQRRPDGTVRDVTPPPFNVRTRVHEYGGGACTVTAEAAYFVHFADQRLYRLALDEQAEPQPLTPADGAYRYADFVVDEPRRRLLAVREDHSGDGEAVNTIVAIGLNHEEDGDNGGTVLAGGHDFYGAPRLSPDGSRLAYLTWDHPNMPWDGTTLWVSDVNDESELVQPLAVAGGREIAVFQPEWSPAGVLHFVADPDGWWNLYRLADGEVEALYPMEAEFGLPQWVFGMRAYSFRSETELVCAYIVQGEGRLGLLDGEAGELTPLELPFTAFSAPQPVGDNLLFMGGSPTQQMSLIRCAPDGDDIHVLARPSDLELDPGYVSAGEPITFPSADGRLAHAFYYAPHSRDFQGPAGEKPPLLVFSHGGPTSRTTNTLTLSIQYWTSRGFGVVDVNYGGSTGYGRAYRDLLKQKWGIVDVEDCVAAATYLAEQGEADPTRLAIRGGSAGGYTTLCALTFHDRFAAGASYFGVSDLTALAQETHKFESRYLDQMVGPLPEMEEVYVARAPIRHVERLDRPVIFFQGAEDRVVPPNQSERMFKALVQKEIPTAYVVYEGEQHGFRQAEHIMHALENELYFYARIFGIELSAGSVSDPVKIENLNESPLPPGEG